MAEIGTSIDKAVNFLQKGMPIGMPTETVYGLAGNGLNTNSIAQIFNIKKRPVFNPLIYHIRHWDQIKEYLQPLSFPYQNHVDELMKKFCPGPITFLFPCKATIPSLGRANLPRIAVRFPAHPMAMEILNRVSFPIVAPSANPFGLVSPSTAQHVNSFLGNKIPYILDGGACSVGIESTIVGWENEKLTIYRKGGINIEEIRNTTSNILLKKVSNSNPTAPGLLSRHYAPKIPLIVGNIERNLLLHKGEGKIGILSFQKKYNSIPINHQKVLSVSGNLEEAAANLFAHLHDFHQLDVDIILAEYVPHYGLGRAINDRLSRAKHM